MNFFEALAHGCAVLKKSNVEDAVRSCEILLCFAAQKSHAFVLSHAEEKLTLAQQMIFEDAILRRAQHEPLAYIVGEKEFFSCVFEVNEHVLIPRPETELLLEKSLQSLRALPQEALSVCDVGTGSGILACLIKKNIPQARVTAVDVSPQALEVAKKNAQNLNVSLDFVEGSLLEGVKGPFHAVISNLPYISTKEFCDLTLSVKEFEPYEALVGGETGTELIEQLIEQAKDKGYKEGMMLLEVGFTQARAVAKKMEQHGFIKVETFQDLSGIERVVKGVFA